MLERRLFLYGLAMVVSDWLGSQRTEAQGRLPDGDVAFYAGRGGRFGYQATPTVCIGGLLVPQFVAEELEAELEDIAQTLKFRIPLHFSTNMYNMAFYQHAISATFARDGVLFSGFRITYASWPSERAAWEYWRQNAEGIALADVAADKALRIYTLQHDFGADQRIYQRIRDTLPEGSSFQIYSSAAQSPRFMQLSGLLSKCLNSPDRLESHDSRATPNGNSQKNALVRETFKAFSLPGLNGDIEQDHLVLKDVTI